MKVEIKNKEIIITLPIEEHASKTGKSIVVASSGGNQPTNVKYKDKILVVGVNAYTKAD